MSKIKALYGLEILDSRGNPTIKVFLETENRQFVCACVPSGASTGEHEALELRDHDPKRYNGKGVLKAVHHVNTSIAKLLVGQTLDSQQRLDQILIDADGTKNKQNLGANAILGASLVIARAIAAVNQQPLYLSIRPGEKLPIPMINIINGGAHADNNLDFQEFMIYPHGAETVTEAIRWGAEIFHTLKSLLKKKGLSTAVGDEGGFAPNLNSHEQALEIILEAIEKAGYKTEKEVSLALDCAASEFYDKKNGFYFDKKRKNSERRSAEEQIALLEKMVNNYPIFSLEDPLDENDWKGWRLLTQKLGDKIQIVGDDIFVTNTEFLERGIREKVANAILIKLNQIGTLTETLAAIDLAQSNGYKTIISHRSGETEDPFIADLAVATDAGQIKTGSLSRSDRVSKYNRLMQIENLRKLP